MTWRFIYFISVDGIIEDMRLHQEISSEDTKSALQVSRSLAADKYADHLIGKRNILFKTSCMRFLYFQLIYNLFVVKDD